MFGSKASIFDTMVKFFKEDDWNFTKIDGETILKMGFKGKNVTMRCFAQANDKSEQMLYYSIMETQVPEEKRALIAEFITRANYGLKAGNFEMDYRDGEVRYKTFIDVEGGELTTGMVKTMVYTNVLMLDKYAPGVMSVLFAGVTPADAIAKIEG